MTMETMMDRRELVGSVQSVVRGHHGDTAHVAPTPSPTQFPAMSRHAGMDILGSAE